MIVGLPQTTVSKIGKKLQELRDSGGVVALGRVLTLLIETHEDGIEAAILAANAASRLHPSRIIVLAPVDSQESRLDAQIRVGGDAGASEVVVLRPSGQALTNPQSLVTGLLLPDAPVVAWWPDRSPNHPAETPLGKIASRRLTDAASSPNPLGFLKALAKNYVAGDSDSSWTRTTLWRAQLAALLDMHLSRKVANIRVFGAENSPSAWLLARWLEMKLESKAELVAEGDGVQFQGIAGVEIQFDSGELKIIRSASIALIKQTGAPDSQVLLPKRSDQDCLIEEMRFLGEDEVYKEVLESFGR